MWSRAAPGRSASIRRLADFTLTSRDGRHDPPRPDRPHRGADGGSASSGGAIARRRSPCAATSTKRSSPRTSPPRSQEALQPIIAKLPGGYRIEMAGSIEESAKANAALVTVFPIMLALMLAVIMFQVALVLGHEHGDADRAARAGRAPSRPCCCSISPSASTPSSGLIGLAGILMRNTLILIGQIQPTSEHGLDPYHAVVEATVQRARPVILTALAAVLAFIPLTHSVFWGSMAYTLIGGTAVGTVLILVFLPALYAIWFRVKPAADKVSGAEEPTGNPAPAEPHALLPRPATRAVDWLAPALPAAEPATRLAPQAPR